MFIAVRDHTFSDALSEERYLPTLYKMNVLIEDRKSCKMYFIIMSTLSTECSKDTIGNNR